MKTARSVPPWTPPWSRARLKLVAVAVALSVAAAPLPALAEVFGGAVHGTLAPPPVLSADQPVPSTLDGLLHGEPAEGVGLVTPPTPDNVGEAHLTYPIDLPSGRADWAPDVSLEYGSGADNGWLGVGWDTGAPAITVDTRWGVPRYDSTVETETYLFEGEQLSPTAHRAVPLPREAERVFTKRVEDTFHLITRHGSTPQDYWWEVQDKEGNTFFYGRTPEDDDGVPDAVLRDDRGAAYWWGLVEQRDISANTVTYFYDHVEDTGVGNGQEAGAPKGDDLYLARINYTGSIDADDPDDRLSRFGPYDVTFTRDQQLGERRRPDVTIDARTGALRVTSQLLRTIEVTYCPARPQDSLDCPAPEAVRSYDLGYDRGPFDKTRLRTVSQAGADGQAWATHEFDYYDDVRDDDGAYQGFDDDRTWNTGQGDGVSGQLADVRPTALGGSVTTSGDGRVYLGFNPISPDKSFSIGGGLELNGSNSTSQIELMDINGDDLPDKVWKADTGPSCPPSCSRVRYRLNQSGPDGGTDFGPPQDLPSLPGLPEENSFGVSIGPEAYFFVGDVMYHHGWAFDNATAYFSDVNADGLVDFVDNGTVYFNRLDEQGNPTFARDSAGTAVPISDDRIAPTMTVDDSEYEQRARRQFPLQDTLRRWIAPWDGEVTITGPVALASPDSSSDGVRVAVQKNGTELWADTIPGGDAQPRTPTVPEGRIEVAKGDRIYFRLQSVDDGGGDAVDWDPVVAYTTIPPALDANGLDVATFTASDDFTLAGRTGIFTKMPLDGRVRLRGVVRKSKPTTDDVQIVVDLNGTNLAADVPVIGAAEVGDFPVDIDVDVAAPRQDPSCPHDPEPCIADMLSLRLGVDSPIDVTALAWTDHLGLSGPELYYLEATRDGEAVTTTGPDGDPIIQLRPPYDIDLYGQSNRSGPQGTWTLPEDDDTGEAAETTTVTVRADVRLAGPVDLSLLPSTVAMTVKGEGGLVGKGTLHLVEPPPDPNPDAPPPVIADSLELTFEARAGERYWFDYTSPDPRLGPLMATDTSVHGSGVEAQSVPDAGHWPRLLVDDDSGDVFPQPYRGWGYAGYNGDGDRAHEPVREDDLVFRRSDFVEGLDNIPTSSASDNPLHGNAYPYAPDVEQHRWQGPKQSVRTSDVDATPRANLKGATWGAAGGANASRVGPDSVRAPGSGGTTGRAPTISGRAEDDSFGGGLAIGPVGFGGGVSYGFSRAVRDFFDLNGDGFPDVVGRMVQYTTPVGGLDPVPVPLGQSAVRTDRSYTGTFGGSGATPSIEASPNGDATAASSDDGGAVPGNAGGNGGGGSGGDQAPAPAQGGGDNAAGAPAGEPSGTSAGVNLGFEGSLGHSETNHDEGFNDWLPYPDKPVETDFADLNGDGLPDQVTVDDGEIMVRWNLGYRFSAPVEFPGDALEEGQSDNSSVGVVAGFNMGRFDFSGGASLQQDEQHADVAWMDVNGDGLPDRLESEYSGTPPVAPGMPPVARERVTVRFNTGAGLTRPERFGNFQDHDVARTESFGVAGGADFTIGIGPLCWPVRLCFVILNPGGHGGRSVSSPRNALVDVDGDGLPDSVTSSDDSSLHVSRNRTGRTNLLRSVQRPLGAAFHLDYERAGNTVDQPFSTWVLAEVTVTDGHEGDGPDETVTRYDYDEATNFFDFAEREMLGYARVTERHLDEDGDVYRSVERVYRNGNYYERGLLAEETLRRGASGPRLTSTATTHELVDAVSPATPVDPASTVASVFPAPVKVEERWHDDSGAVAKAAVTETDYDARGNAVEINDRGEPGSADDAIARTAFTACADDESFPWTQVPESLTIVAGDGAVLRRRVGDVPCDYAAIVRLDEHLAAGADGDAAGTDVGYADPGGEVNLVVGPANADDEREELAYTYDRLTGMLVSVKNRSLGLETTITWDNRFGRVASVTDPNGAVTSYTYDAQGRLASVAEPLEHARDARTVSFSYGETATGTPWSRAAHFDAANPDDPLETIRFVDGVGKEVQTKKDATVFDEGTGTARDVRVVSGATFFDFLGRAVRELHPVTEPLTAPITTFNTDEDPVTEAVTAYDERDRVTMVTAPPDAVTTTTYGFGAGPSGALMAVSEVTDPEGMRTRTYTDVRGNQVGVERAGRGGETAVTAYAYDPLGQLVQILDPGQATTSIAYDLLGRQVRVDAPDTGRMDVGYDLASNVVSRVTPTLRAAGQQITYEHEYTRLSAVRYPANPRNDETYTYGSTGDAGNTAGRIARVEDGSRTQDRTYDLAGNLVEQTDVMKVHNLSPETEADHTYTTAFVRDTWGRVLQMTYPDGEVVTNAYDAGGLVRAVSGVKDEFAYRYVDRMEYDKFGFRRVLDYGNGVTTKTSYDPETLWLRDQQVHDGAAVLQNLSYSYDRVGNVRKRTDDIPMARPNEMGGPSAQTFAYDGLHRLTAATGTYAFPPDKRRDYTLALTYNAAGLVATKEQRDTIDGKEQRDTTYQTAYTYEAGPARAPSRVGSRAYSWDANGNNTGWVEDQGNRSRTITWDEANRAASIADQGSTTAYRYDDDDILRIERGPQGEVEYVAEWYTALNGGVAWKHVFAGDLRVSTTRVKADAEERERYFLTGDLVGSITLVTDAGGKVFEHLEYFPGGEIWVREKSVVYRQPNLYAGLYYDEFRSLYRTDARWYDPRDAMMLSPDPLLVERPGAAVDDPRLLADYTYSFDNPVRYVDQSGRAPTDALSAFIEGHVPVPLGLEHAAAARTDFEKRHPAFARVFGTGIESTRVPDAIDQVTGFLDRAFTIEVGIGSSGLQLKRFGLIKRKRTSR